MQTVPLSQVEIVDRQRKEITPKELIELKRSIVSKGLLHAPVLSYPGPLYRLVAGERRTVAMQQLHEEGIVFTYNNDPVPTGHIPFVLIGDLVPADLQEAELEENILRMPLTWMEEAEAKAKIHQLRVDKAVQAGEKAPTIVSTAKYIAEKSGKDPNEITRHSKERKALQTAIIVARHKDLPEVQKAKNIEQAYAAILDKQERAFKALLASKAAGTEDKLQLIKGDALVEMKKFAPELFDIIFTDPPYGIDADTMKNDSKHFYKDDVESAMKVCHAIISEGFRITKRRAVLFMWCDIQHFLHLRDFAAMQGWVPWRTPLVWHKGDQGHAPWGRAGFVRTYELLLFAVKGQRELFLSGGPDVILRKSTPTTRKVHAAEKPVEIITAILEKAALEGESVLDPCCGSGGIFEAANKLRLKATGIEISPDYQNMALARIGDIQNGQDTSQEDESPVDEVDDLL